MPYLNWKDADLKQEIHVLEASGPSEKVHLDLTFPASKRGEILEALRGVLSGPAPEAGAPAELRIDLPRRWILFWKLRLEESRLLIAHPEPEEWVATASLSEGHAQAVLNRLAALEAGQSLSVGELGFSGGMSNGEIVLGLC